MADSNHEASTDGINLLEGEVVLENTHPSLVNWLGQFFWALLFFLVAASIQISELAVVGLLIVAYVFVSRQKSRYVVTNQRIKVSVGLLSSTTGEMRIDDISSIGTTAGLFEKLVGKGSIVVSTVGGEELVIAGVGNYEGIARTIREQQNKQGRYGQQAGRPRQRDRSEPAPDHQRREQPRSASASEPRSNADADASERERTQPCVECGESIPTDTAFCPECGAEDPHSERDEGAPERTERGDEPTTESEDDPRRPVTAERKERSLEEDEPDERPIRDAARAVADGRRFDAELPRELCEDLSDPPADPSRLESTLRDAVERLEAAESVTETLEGTTDSDRLQRQLATVDGDLSEAVLSVVDRSASLEDDLRRVERDHERLQEAAEAVCDAVNGEAEYALSGSGPRDRLQELRDAIRSGEVTVGTADLQQVVSRAESATRPESTRSMDLLDGLANLEDVEQFESVLRSTVEALDRYDELESTVADIEVRDVRMRLESLDEELRGETRGLYQHLADRVRELDAMLNRRDGVDDVQLYAIYQECTFYDRTLLPRLSRSLDTQDSADVDGLLDDVEARITNIEEEYIAVRADHNHTIPRHFLELAEDLCADARHVESQEPRQAVGTLIAADAILDHVEQLYQRNEYSVMLRRLRG